MPNIPYEFYQKFFWTSPELHTKYSKNSCEFLVVLYGNMHKCTVIHMKFIWRVILCQMQFHMNDTNRPS